MDAPEPSVTEKILKLLKLSIPHVLIISGTLLYVLLFAIICRAFEFEADRDFDHRELLETVEKSVEKLTDWRLNTNLGNITETEWRNRLWLELDAITSLDVNIADLRKRTSRWSHYFGVFIYVLSILSTCGYDYVVPSTPWAELFLIVYAAVGIPLIFMFAANNGMLLSGVVRRVWDLTDQAVDTVEKCASRNCKTAKEPEAEVSVRSPRSVRFNLDSSTENQTPVEEQRREPKVKIAIMLYLSIMVVYYACGALIFMYWENWEFLKSFHFSFAITSTLGITEIVPESYLYIFSVTAYVLGGMAVVTCCIELASEHLIDAFADLHYFGRPKPRKYRKNVNPMIEMLPFVLDKNGKINFEPAQLHIILTSYLLNRLSEVKNESRFEFTDNRALFYSLTLYWRKSVEKFDFLGCAMKNYNMFCSIIRHKIVHRIDECNRTLVAASHQRPYVPRHVQKMHFIDSCRKTRLIRSNSFQSDMILSSRSTRRTVSQRTVYDN